EAGRGTRRICRGTGRDRTRQRGTAGPAIGVDAADVRAGVAGQPDEPVDPPAALRPGHAARPVPWRGRRVRVVVGVAAGNGHGGDDGSPQTAVPGPAAGSVCGYRQCRRGRDGGVRVAMTTEVPTEVRTGVPTGVRTGVRTGVPTGVH